MTPGWHKLECDFQIVIMTKGSSAMSSPEELTFVLGRWLRPIVAVLHVVRRITFQPISSREQDEYRPEPLIRARFVPTAFQSLRFARLPLHCGTATGFRTGRERR